MSGDSYDVLAVLPTERDHEALADADEEYHIHWMDDEHFGYPYPDAAFDMVEYTERCSSYVEEAGIDAVVYSHDYANLVAGVLTDRHDLLGPGLESMFLTNHKYYSRKHQPDTIWFDYIDLDTGEWGELDPRFPCYVKPPMMTMTLLQNEVDTQAELDDILDMMREEKRSLREMYADFFEAYLDTERYPLATADIEVVEKPVTDWSQHCVEGWVDPHGEIHVWAISDHHYYPGEERAIDNYCTPSTLPVDVQHDFVDLAFDTVEDHGVEEGFWNVEIWEFDDEYVVTEINGRAATVWETLYNDAFDTSVYDGMLALACGQTEKVHEVAPDWKPGEDPERVCAQFHTVTFGEGRAEEFLDFEFARSVDDPEIELLYDPDDEVDQTKTSGEWLARFQLCDDDYETVRDRGDELRSRMLKRPELSPDPEERL